MKKRKNDDDAIFDAIAIARRQGEKRHLNLSLLAEEGYEYIDKEQEKYLKEIGFKKQQLEYLEWFANRDYQNPRDFVDGFVKGLKYAPSLQYLQSPKENQKQLKAA